jgi:hypothetical protein
MGHNSTTRVWPGRRSKCGDGCGEIWGSVARDRQHASVRSRDDDDQMWMPEPCAVSRLYEGYLGTAL